MNWFGKDCEHLICQWEDDEETGGPYYQEQVPVLFFCNHKGSPERTEGNCREAICPLRVAADTTVIQIDLYDSESRMVKYLKEPKDA